MKDGDRVVFARTRTLGMRGCRGWVGTVVLVRDPLNKGMTYPNIGVSFDGKACTYWCNPEELDPAPAPASGEEA